MSKMIAAFHWDSSKKEVSTLFVEDKTWKVRNRPKNIKCNSTTNHSVFTKNANDAISDFFNEINNLQTLGNTVLVEYKIVSGSGPIVRYKNRFAKQGVESDFVEKTFKTYLSQYKLKHRSLRTNLKKEALSEFTKMIKGLNLMGSNRGEAFKHRVWAVALHATKKTYSKKVFSVFHAKRHSTKKKKDVQPLFRSWVSNL
ncbi:MAG: hypothetical protein KDD61_00590 [Bdellovibrionales bacterium]|nr:hypothetical protein [Bdellovibrionales bacterium]